MPGTFAQCSAWKYWVESAVEGKGKFEIRFTWQMTERRVLIEVSRQRNYC